MSAQRKRSWPAIVVLAIVGLVVSFTVAGSTPANADPPIPVAYGDVLDIPGGHYKLTGDIAFAPGDPLYAVTIVADNVRFDLAGYTIAGPGDGTGAGVNIVACSGAHVVGGTITGFFAGVNIEAGYGHKINGNVLTGNVGGFQSGGVRIAVSSGNQITGNLIVDNPFAGILGFGVFGSCNDNEVVGNTISGSTVGVWFAAIGPGLTASNNRIRGNMITNTNLGVLITTVALFPAVNDGNVITGNTVNGNGSGIVLVAGPGSLVSNNVIRGNQANGNGVGISIFAGVPGGTLDNLMQGNTALDNGVDLVDNDCPNNIWKSNTFVTKSENVPGCIQ